jgi:predicted transcriptional regulator
MLTQKEILNEIFTLPITEQRKIAEKIENNIKQNNGKAKDALSIGDRLGLVKSLAGSLKMENPPMTKEEEREIIYERLSEKYK